MILPTEHIILIVGIIAIGLYGLYKLRQDFSERLFLKLGLYLFLVQGIANSYGLYAEWSLLPVYGIVAKIASTAFTFLIAFFFYWLMNKTPPEMGGAGIQLSPEQISELLEAEK